jgi:hypothetical protein
MGDMTRCEYCDASAISTVTSRYARPCIPPSVRVCWPHERDLFDQGDGVSRRSVSLRRPTLPHDDTPPLPMPLPPAPIRSSVLTLVASLEPHQIPRPYVQPVIVTEQL